MIELVGSKFYVMLVSTRQVSSVEREALASFLSSSPFIDTFVFSYMQCLVLEVPQVST